MPAPLNLAPDDARNHDASQLAMIPKYQMVLHFINYAYEVYVAKLPTSMITTWTPEICNSFMEMYLDKLQYNINPLPSNFHQIIIAYAIDRGWTVAELVWTTIAVHTNAMPILWSTIAEAFNTSNGGDFGWRMPIPVNRQIRHVNYILLPNTWFEDSAEIHGQEIELF